VFYTLEELKWNKNSIKITDTLKKVSTDISRFRFFNLVVNFGYVKVFKPD
jgi:hypothetical protein